jgi:hypothetical protein
MPTIESTTRQNGECADICLFASISATLPNDGTANRVLEKKISTARNNSIQNMVNVNYSSLSMNTCLHDMINVKLYGKKTAK